MKFFERNPRLKTILGYFFITCLAFLLFYSLQSLNTLPDPDSFYHAKVAIYLSQGVLIKNFPWLPFTILKDYYYDHHFLYHLFLIPFVKFFEPLRGIKIAAVFLATGASVLFYWFLRKFKFKFPFLFTMLLFTVPLFLIRLSLAKAPASALIFLFLGLYALFKRKHFLLLLISFFYVWLYNTWPILFVATLIYCFSVALRNLINQPLIFAKDTKQSLISLIPTEKQIFSFKIVKSHHFQLLRDDLWQKIYNLFAKAPAYFLSFFRYLLKWENIKIILVCLAGVSAGLVINPYFPQNLYFDWVHIVKIGLINLQSKIGVGAEWYPYDPKSLILNAPFVFLFFLLASAWFFVSFKKSKEHRYFGQKAKTLALFILSWLFFIYTIKSRRNVEYFVPLAIAFSAFAFQPLFSSLNWSDYFQRLKKLFHFPYNILSVLLTALLALNLQFAAFYFLDRAWLSTQRRLEGGIPLERYKKVGEWMKENVKAGEIIFHSSWDDFPMLFYWNDHNVYIIGLDTTFMYEKNPELYWKWEKISFGKTKENLAQVLKEKFNSSYIHVRLDRKELEENLKADKNFEKVYEDEEGKIYKIK